MHPLIYKRLQQVAIARNRVFVNMKRNRPLGKNYEEVGLLGEWEFGKFCGIMPRTIPGGDGGIDFELPLVFTVDVKTARKPDRLLVEAGKVKADIYVLAHYVDNDEAGEVSLVGWIFASELLKYQPFDSGRGIVNHVVPAEELRPMDDLEKRVKK